MFKIEDKYELRFTSTNAEGNIDSIGIYNNSDEEGIVVNLLPTGKEEILVYDKEELEELEEKVKEVKKNA